MKSIKELNQLLEKRAAIKERADNLWGKVSDVRGMQAKGSLRRLRRPDERDRTLLKSWDDVSDELRQTDRAICVVTAAEIHGWNEHIVKKRAELFSRFIDAISPFFGGPQNEKDTRRQFEHLEIPISGLMNRALLEAPRGLSDRLTAANALAAGRDVVDQIDMERLISLIPAVVEHERRFCSEFGWPPPEELERPGPKEPWCPAVYPANIRARFRKSMPLDELAQILGRRNPKPHYPG